LLYLTLVVAGLVRLKVYSSPELARLGVGRLIGDLTTALEDRVSGRSPLRLAVYSAKDIVLVPFLSSLDVFGRDWRWPPFTSHVEIELFRKGNQDTSSSSVDGDGAAPRKDHYVRVRYNGQTMRLPACAAHDKHFPGTDGEVCTLDAFVDVAKKFSMTQEEWVRECSYK
jgi:acid phosphatase